MCAVHGKTSSRGDLLFAQHIYKHVSWCQAGEEEGPRPSNLSGCAATPFGVVKGACDRAPLVAARGPPAARPSSGPLPGPVCAGAATAGNAGSLPHEDTQDTKNGLLQNVSVWPHRRITRHAHPGPHLHPVLFPLLFPQSMWDSNSNGLFSSLLFWRVLQQGNRPPGRKARPRARGARRHGGTGCDARGGAHRVLPERFLECAPTVTSSPDPRTRCSP